LDPNGTLLPLTFAVSAVLIAILRLRKVQTVFVPDYQRGLRFVKGAYVDEVGPGSYRIAGTNQHIEVVDMRPQSVILDRTFYRDAWNNTALISVSADLLVADARRATTALKDQINDSMPLARNALRTALSRSTASEDPSYRTQAAADITQAVNAELDAVGMKVQNVEVVEFWLRPMSGETTGVAQ
jgi:SPFH domain / Band 7 family